MTKRSQVNYQANNQAVLSKAGAKLAYSTRRCHTRHG